MESNIEKTLVGKYEHAKVSTSRRWKDGEFDYQKYSIERIDPNTKEVKEYESITAAVSDGFDHSSISLCVAGKMASHENYFWRRAGEAPPTVVAQYGKIFYNVIGINETDGSTVELYSFADCDRLGFKYDKIRACCTGLSGRRVHKGHKWHYSDPDRQKEAEANRVPSREEKQIKQIKRICIKTRDVKIYDCQKSVEADGFSMISVRRVCRGERPHHMNYNWEYINERI